MGKSSIMSVKITGNGDDAAKAFEKVTAKASAFGSFMGGAALKGVTALWDGIKGFTTDVLDMSDSTQKFMSTMGFAGLDQTAIDAAKKATREYADQTVYDLTTVQNTTAQLAANGVKDYVGLTKAAGNLNAVAGGNADTFQSVAMVMTQTAGAGKLTTENYNQLADAIPGASGKLQEALKKNKAYTGNFRDAMADGQITAEEFNQAIMDLGMSDVAQQAATSTDTMEGAIGNLEAAITGGLTDAFDLIKPTVTGALGVAAEKVTWFSEKAVTGIKGVYEILSDGAVMADFLDAFGITEDSPVITGLYAVKDAIDWTVDRFHALSDWAGAHGEEIKSTLVGIGVGLAVFKVASTITAVVTALQQVGPAARLAAAGQAVLNAVMAANPIVLVITLIASLVAGLVYFFTQTEKGRAVWQSFTDFLGQKVSQIVQWFNELPGRISRAFADAGQWLRDAGQKIIQGLWDGLKAKWDAVTGWFSGIGDWIVQHKGPPAKDATLLTRNGRLIMQSLAKGLTSGFDTDVRAAVQRINTRMAGMEFAVNAGSVAQPAGTTYNVTITGEVIDKEGTAYAIRRLLRDYDARRA